MTRRTTWIVFGVYLLAIYATLPVMRDVVNYVKQIGVVDGVTYGINGIGFLVVGGVIVRQRDTLNWWNILVLVGVGATLVTMVLRAKWPAERIHFLQYALLASVAYVGFNFKRGPIVSLLLTVVLVTGAGWLDEGIQYLLPRRHYNIHDVAYNGIGALLGGITMAAGLPGLSQQIQKT